jgi:hypothetical protein
MRIAPFVFLLFLSFAFKSDDALDNLIIPGEKVGPINLGYTTIEEAREMLGISAPVIDHSYRGQIRTHWFFKRQRRRWKRKGNYSISPLFTEKGYIYQYSLEDSLMGIKLLAKYENLHIINQVYLTAPCKWKTIDGIGIGSSFEEIKAKMGEPFIDDERDGYEKYLWYFDFGNSNCEVTFLANSHSGSRVSQIEIDYSGYKRDPGRSHGIARPAFNRYRRRGRGCVKC